MAPDYRRRRETRKLGARILVVETSDLEGFGLTRRSYLRIGFEMEGRIRNFYQDVDDKAIFRIVFGSAHSAPLIQMTVLAGASKMIEDGRGLKSQGSTGASKTVRRGGHVDESRVVSGVDKELDTAASFSAICGKAADFHRC